MGADVAVGTTQRFGVPMGFGGPHAGYLAVRAGLERSLARSAGRRERRRRRRAGVPAGPADPRAAHPPREGDQQHLHRPGAARRDGLDVRRLPRAGRAGRDRRPGRAVRRGAGRGAARRRRRRWCTTTFFDTVLVRVPGSRRPRWCARPASAGSTCGWSTTTTSASASTRRRPGSSSRPCSRRSAWSTGSRRRLGCVGRQRDWLPASLLRESDYLTHPVFHAHRSETAMLRYLRRLADRDYALDRGMIPLGSCTMKLNATTEMEPITWPEFADLHPFAPVEQTEGIRALIDDLSTWLAELTGYDAVSLQPNAGSQGELAGLARDPGLPPGQRPGRPPGLPDPGQRPRHQRRERGHGRHEGRRGQDRRRRIDRPGRPAGQGRCARRGLGGDHGHLPVDPRRLRGHHLRAVRPGARRRRSGLRRRRQPQRAGRAGPAGPVRRRREPPQPAQDVLHPARWRRSGCRPDRRTVAPGAVPAEPPAGAGGRAGDRDRAGLGRAVRLGRHPADQLGLRAADGRRGSDGGDPDGGAVGELRCGPAAFALSGALLRPRRAGRARVHPRPARRSPGRPG